MLTSCVDCLTGMIYGHGSFEYGSSSISTLRVSLIRERSERLLRPRDLSGHVARRHFARCATRYSVGNERPFLIGTCPLRVKRQNTLKEQILSAVAPATDIDSLAMVLRGSGRPGLWIECHSDYLPKDHPDPFEVSFQSARATSEFQLLSGREPTPPSQERSAINCKKWK